MMDASRIEPGQRYAWRMSPEHSWRVERRTQRAPHRRFGQLGERHPIVEPERLHEIKAGWTVLNVATGEQFEWRGQQHWHGAFASDDTLRHLTPLLALVATPEESNGD